MENFTDNFQNFEKKYPILQSYIVHPWNEKTIESIKFDFTNHKVRQFDSYSINIQNHNENIIKCLVTDSVITKIYF